MGNKYLNEAIIGNKNMMATFTEKGELERLYFPTKDNRQYINYFHTGVKINNSDLIYLHDDINNVYKQYYDTDTNILNTETTNTYFNLKVLQTDFIMMKENVLVKKYVLMNEGKIDLNVSFFIHSELVSDQNNLVGCRVLDLDNGMMQYCHDFVLSTFAKGRRLLSYQINGSSDTIKRGEISDKDYIGMSKDSSISCDLGVIKPKEKKSIEIAITVDENKNISDIEREIDRITKIDFDKEYTNVKSYWRKYVKQHNGLNIKEPKNSYEEKIYEIYKRSILLFPLLTNEETGGIIASPEIDEYFTRCGRYAYCWPRDAVFITRALDILKMDKETDKFYKVFCKKTQSKNGMWEQRFYTDGKLAPCWGYQIDETASVVYGVYEHYKYTKSEKFLKDNLQMCEKAIDFLKRYVEDWLNLEGKNEHDKDRVLEEIEKERSLKEHKYHISYDLWEMCEGIHLYSLASIYSAFDCILQIYRALGNKTSDFENNRLKEEKISKNEKEIERLQTGIKKFINENMYDEEKKSYVRNTEDKKMDISIIGSVIPFNVFKPKEKKILNTVERINLSLRTYTGGYQRFEQDHYMNGNPWPIANLWMTLYYLETGEKRKAKETFDFVLKTAGKHNFLGEQIDNSTLQPSWVIGLGWAHAMFIIVMEKMNKK